DWSIFATGTPKAREQWYAEMTGPAGAAFTACTLLALQDAPLDMAYFYTAEPQGFGLFSQYGEPRKSYYALKAFRQLLETPNRVRCSGSQAGQLNIAAGLNEERTSLNVLVSSFRHPATAMDLMIKGIPWAGKTRCEVLEIGREADWKVRELQSFSGSEFRVDLGLEPASIRLLRFQQLRGLK
ncbi:MAG TPA: hypothetical protein VNZ22_02430, partial [Bacillota bacterium]|nr:hypothetical protein [Bacillota bacterium]